MKIGMTSVYHSPGSGVDRGFLRAWRSAIIWIHSGRISTVEFTKGLEDSLPPGNEIFFSPFSKADLILGCKVPETLFILLEEQLPAKAYFS